MRDYVTTGWQLPRDVIATPYMGDDAGDNVWGYEREAAAAVRDAAFILPIMAPAPWPSDTPRDYYVISMHRTMRKHRLWSCPCNPGQSITLRLPNPLSAGTREASDTSVRYGDLHCLLAEHPLQLANLLECIGQLRCREHFLTSFER